MRRFKSIDSLRGISALLVAVLHIEVLLFPSDDLSFTFVHYLISQGGFGVDLFFAISGFCLGYSSLISTRKFSFKVFYLKRFLKIYPAHIVMTFGLLLAFIWGLPFGARDITATSWICNFLLLIDPKGTGRINPVTWSLVYELVFYMIFPVVIAAFKSGSGWTVYVVYCLIAICAHFLQFNIFFFDGRFLTFLHGIVIATYVARQKSLPAIIQTRPKTWSVLLFGLALASLALVFGPHSNINFQAFILLKGISAGLVLAWMLVANIWSNTLNFIGKISYSLYLVHFAVVKATGLIVNHFDYAPSLVSVSAALALSIICATILWGLVERPVLRVQDKLITPKLDTAGT